MAYGAVYERLLAVHGFLSAVRASYIIAVRLHVARLHCIGQISGKNLVAEMAD
jgi:hypothetical protein